MTPLISHSAKREEKYMDSINNEHSPTNFHMSDENAVDNHIKHFYSLQKQAAMS